MKRAIGIVDSYGYASIMQTVVWQRMVVPMPGGSPDDSIVRAGLPHAKPWLAGAEISLADVMVALTLACLSATPEAAGRVGARRWRCGPA